MISLFSSQVCLWIIVIEGHFVLSLFNQQMIHQVSCRLLPYFYCEISKICVDSAVILLHGHQVEPNSVPVCSIRSIHDSPAHFPLLSPASRFFFSSFFYTLFSLPFPAASLFIFLILSVLLIPLPHSSYLLLLLSLFLLLLLFPPFLLQRILLFLDLFYCFHFCSLRVPLLMLLIIPTLSYETSAVFLRLLLLVFFVFSSSSSSSRGASCRPAASRCFLINPKLIDLLCFVITANISAESSHHTL